MAEREGFEPPMGGDFAPIVPGFAHTTAAFVTTPEEAALRIGRMSYVDDSGLGLGRTGHVGTAAERRFDLAMTFRTLRDLDRGPVVLGETIVD